MKIPPPPSLQPIPDHAKRVFEGVHFDVYQWDQEMYDDSVRTFEKIQRPPTVIVFPVLPDDKIVLTKQMQPGFPKPAYGAAAGSVDPGETPFECAQRELREETGYWSDDWKLWRTVQLFPRIEWEIYVFIARNCTPVGDGSLQEDGGEQIETFTVDFEEFLEYASDPEFYEKEIIVDVLHARLDPVKKQALKDLFYGPNN